MRSRRYHWRFGASVGGLVGFAVGVGIFFEALFVAADADWMIPLWLARMFILVCTAIGVWLGGKVFLKTYDRK